MNATSLCCTDTFPQFDTSHQLSDIFMVSHKITLPRSQTTHSHALLCFTYSQPSLLRFFRVTPFLPTSLWTYWATIAYVFLQCVPPALSRIIPAHILCVRHQCLWGTVTAPIRCPRSNPQDRGTYHVRENLRGGSADRTWFDVAGFEGWGRNLEPRNANNSGKCKRQENASFLEPLERNAALPMPWF